MPIEAIVGIVVIGVVSILMTFIPLPRVLNMILVPVGLIIPMAFLGHLYIDPIFLTAKWWGWVIFGLAALIGLVNTLLGMFYNGRVLYRDLKGKGNAYSSYVEAVSTYCLFICSAAGFMANFLALVI
ncbi:MAG: hypothetical protein IKA61_06755 [Clostridia bacterium]|nr:hypothetical protein [Clostridia bacterium]